MNSFLLVEEKGERICQVIEGTKKSEDIFTILSLSVVRVQEIRQEEIDNYVPCREK